MKDSFAVRNKELLLSVGFFSLEQRQPGLWQGSAEPEVAWRERAGVGCSMSLLVQEPGAISDEAGRSQGQPEQKEGVPPAVDRNTSQSIMGKGEGVLPNRQRPAESKNFLNRK